MGSRLHTTCRPCAKKLGIGWTLPLLLSERPCEGCGTIVGYPFGPVKYGDQTVMMANGPLTAPYTHFWQHDAWPIALGMAVQDRYGKHVHEWTTTYANFETGERRESCRCGERRTTSAPPTPEKPGT